MTGFLGFLRIGVWQTEPEMDLFTLRVKTPGFRVTTKGEE